MLHADDVSKRFATVEAVRNVSLTVERGSSFALLGPDGAGKTTLMRLLVGALRADSGKIELDGVDVRKKPADAQRLIGYMPQQFSLYPTLSIAENVRFFARVYGVGRDSPFIAELLETSRLTPFLERQSRRLSGGMKQKLGLICAVLHKPRVLFLDEPTTGVDPVSRRDFWTILYRLLSEGMTLITTTPYMDEAERCHRVGLLSEGRIIAEATPKELTAQIPAEVLEIVCDRPPLASRTLREVGGVLGVQVFADRLRVLASPSDEAAYRSRLAADGFRVSAVAHVAPSMEDVFIAQVVTARANDRKDV
jgi:ABC-2 type transport system ATP-binding protein